MPQRVRRDMLVNPCAFARFGNRIPDHLKLGAEQDVAVPRTFTLPDTNNHPLASISLPFS